MAASDLAGTVFEELRDVTIARPLAARERFIRMRTILDHLGQELTRREPRTFTGMFDRLVFLFDQRKVPETLVRQIHNFRKRANLGVHSLSFAPTEADCTSALRAICDVTELFTGIPVPKDLRAQYAQAPATKPERQVRTSQQEQISEMRVVMRSLSMGAHTDRDGKESPVARIAGVNEDGDEVTISLWNDYAEIGSLGWPYATLLFLDIKRVEGTGNLYSTTEGSLVVIEPDYLVNATAVAETFPHANAIPYIVQKMVSSPVSEALILGKMANECFNILMENPTTKLDEAANAAIHASPSSMLAMAAYPDIADHVTHTLPTHFKALQQVVNAFPLAQAEFTAEPTYLSARYGIQGRPDAVVEYPQDPTRREVIELKSGKFPTRAREIDGFTGEMWPIHFAQTVCYNMLLESAHSDRTGPTSILYSADERGRLRNAQETRRNRKRALMARNRIIALEHQIQSGDVSALRRLTTDDASHYTGFIRDKVAQFAATLDSISPLEREYFFAYASYIAREQWIAKIGKSAEDGPSGFAALWRQSIDEKREQFVVLAGLYLDSLPSGDTVRLKVKGYEESTPIWSNFRAGDPGILYPLELDGDARPLDHQLLKGTVVRLSGGEVEFKLNNRRISRRYFSAFKDREWVIEHDLSDNGFNNMYESLFQFVSASAMARNRLLGRTDPRFAPVASVNTTGNLTDHQETEVIRALSAQDYYLLQAPPGTGKTTRIVRALVEYLFDRTNDDVLVLAYTNRAVDEICGVLEKLNGDSGRDPRQKVEYIRLGRLWNTHYKPHTLAQLVQASEPEDAEERIRGTRVFVSTVHSFLGTPELMGLKRFATAIVDEASQLLEPHLIGILSQVQRFILIGDQKQLPAVSSLTEDEGTIKNEELVRNGFHNLRTSLFERLWNQCEAAGWTNALGNLTQQGRMHEQLQAFPSKQFYLGRLELLNSVDQRRSIQRFQDDVQVGSESPLAMRKVLGRHRLIFIPTPPGGHRGAGQQVGGVGLSVSKVNMVEAARCASLVQTVADEYGSDFKETTVGVITPWRAQAAVIKRLVAEKLGSLAEKVKVDTVERFQGGTCEIIIVSFCINRSDQLDVMSNLKRFHDANPPYFVDRKLNVALTRARSHIILLGRRELLNLAREGIYRELLNHVDKTGYVCTDYDIISSIGTSHSSHSGIVDASSVAGKSPSTRRRWWPFARRT